MDVSVLPFSPRDRYVELAPRRWRITRARLRHEWIGRVVRARTRRRDDASQARHRVGDGAETIACPTNAIHPSANVKP
jgi:hypothetical protein